MSTSSTSALRFSADKAELDIDTIHAFLRDEAHWSKGIPRDVVERAIAGSLCFGAYLDARLVGFARLVTDHATFAYLCDVFVLSEHRGKGYGRALIDHVFAQDACAASRSSRATRTRCIARSVSPRPHILSAGWSCIGPASMRSRMRARAERGCRAPRPSCRRAGRAAHTIRAR